MKKALKATGFALMVTILSGIALAAIFGSAVGTFYLISLFVVMTEGWQLFAAIVWMLEMVFMISLFFELKD